MDNPSPKNRWNRYLMGIGVALMTLITTYLVHTNPTLNMADLTNPTIPAGASKLYIPNYDASAGESGLMEIKANGAMAIPFDSITFTMSYSPVDALIFDNNPIVFDGATKFQSAAFQMTATPEPGKLIVTIIADDEVTLLLGDVLFKLNTEINSELPIGQTIDLSISDLAILDGSNPVSTDDMPDSMITVQGQNELKALNAKAIDSTHVAIEFSDYIASRGTSIDYDVCEDGDYNSGISACNPGSDLAVSDPIEPGTSYGLSQKYVVLTTASMTAGQEYTVTLDSSGASGILSNQQGQMDDDYSNVIFHGYGQASATLSDFGIANAIVTGYNAINVIFTDDVEIASVTKDDFNLNLLGGAPILIDDVASVSGSNVVLSVTNTNLLKDNTYQIKAASPDAILRDSDGESLGMDRVTFAGAKNGPRLIGATVNDAGGTYRLQLTFDEDIQLGGIANNPVGRLYSTVAGDAGTLIDDGVAGTYNQSISGKTLILENPAFNNANANFTFAVTQPAWITNAKGVPVDDTYKAISFWGLGHDNSSNSVGAVDVTKKDAITIPEGNLDFSTVDPGEVSILYDSGAPPLSSAPIQSVGLSGSDLRVTLPAGSTFNPDRHYILRIHNGAGNTIVAKDFAVSRELDIAYAQPVSNAGVRVYFSENVDGREIDFTDFSVFNAAGGPIAVTGLSIDPGYQSAVLTTAGPFDAANVYQVTVNNPSDIWSYAGDYMLQRSVYFTGYNTQYSVSPVTLSSVTALSAQRLRMDFSGPINEETFTPVNLDVFWFGDPTDPRPVTRNKLVITEVIRIDEDSYELRTAVQDAGENYFVVFDGVEDADGLRIGNHKVHNFFGFQLPQASINLVTPSTITNDENVNVIISGKNLDVVDEVRVGTESVDIVNQSATSITILIPAGFTTGLYGITLIDTANNSLVFSNALLITSPDQELTVHSDQSKSTPYTVPNDGETVAKLWVLVEDPVDLNNVSSVVINLSQIGGPSTVEMVKDNGTQPQFSQWYTYETTVPPTVQTKDEPYLLPVEVRRGSETFYGTASLRVSKDVEQSVAPVIDRVYISPLSVPPNGETPVKISAQVTDQDGAGTIDSVVADLGALGIGFKTLSPIGEVTEGGELETQFFESEEFTVPDTTQLGTYNINVVASDITGEQTTSSLELKVSTEATGPKIDQDVSYISPRKSIPRDGKTAFSVNVFVSDPDGISDIQTVTASFGTAGIDPISLKKDAEASTEGESAWYQVTGLTIPKTAPLGIHNVEVRATDKDGGVANLILQIEVTHKDTLGDPPRIVDDRSYTTPRVAVNDGETPITLYAFVQDDDDDVESVVANLSSIGQVGGENGGTLGGDDDEVSDGSCPTGSNVLVCMNPSVSEGANGQWYILPGVTVSTMTAPSANPYQVEVIVTDAGGKTTRGTIPVYVGTGDAITDQQQPPKALAAIPTSPTTLEVLFNKEISANSITSSGRHFTVTSQSNINETLYVVGATINPAGTVVTLSTENQISGKRYTLSVSKDIKDILGRSVVEGAENRLNFAGFEPLNKAPIVEYLQPTDFNMLELEFRNSLKPSSVVTGMSQTDASDQYGIHIYESEDTSKALDVLGVTLSGSGNLLQIKTGPQTPDRKYRVNLEGLASYDGTTLPVAINKGFKGYNLSVAQHAAAANLADLNNDGRVDFSDFTIFSSVYGTVYSGQGQNVEDAAALAEAQAAAAAQQAGQPLEEDPDATVPITSEPTGGTTQ